MGLPFGIRAVARAGFPVFEVATFPRYATVPTPILETSRAVRTGRTAGEA